jgi:ribulose 1,5-bisphosphate synthetase/thiazole synthase
VQGQKSFRLLLSRGLRASAQGIDSTEEIVAESEKFDLVIIGCGPAGEKAGAQAAYFGKRVAVIERAGVPGGSCINTGTVPSKTLRESALYFPAWGSAGFTGSIIL